MIGGLSRIGFSPGTAHAELTLAEHELCLASDMISAHNIYVRNAQLFLSYSTMQYPIAAYPMRRFFHIR